MTEIVKAVSIFLLIFVILIFLNLPTPKVLTPESQPVLKSNVSFIDGIYNHKFNNTCEIEPWNRITTSSIPNIELIQKLADKKITGSEGITDGDLRLVSAYLYADEVVVTTTWQHTQDIGSKSVYCRYYDCNRVEIPNSTFKSFFFPLTAVHCARRAGAHFISLSFESSNANLQPIPFVKRLAEKPPHDLGVCVGQIYGPDRKWMDNAEFVEHHKIIGVSMFYFTIFSIDEYSRTLLDEYVRTGYAEVSYINTEYTNGYMYLHMVQLHDCFFRARHHSKWMLSIDHDEILVPTKKNFINYIDSLSSEYAELIFPMRRIHKTERSLEVFKDSNEIKNNIQMSMYNTTLDKTYINPKMMVQPTKVQAILIHRAYGHSPGYRVLSIPKSIALINHYRGDSGYEWTNSSMIEVVDKKHVDLMETRVVRVVEYVFKKHNITCDSVSEDWKILTIKFLKKINIC